MPRDRHKPYLDREISKGRRVLCSGPQPGATVSQRGKIARMLEREQRGWCTWAGAQMVGFDGAPVSPHRERGKGFWTVPEGPPLYMVHWNPLLSLSQGQACWSAILSHTMARISGVAPGQVSPPPFPCPCSRVWLADQPGSAHTQTVAR